MMLGEGGLEEVQGADRWKEYGDVEWRTTDWRNDTIKGAAEKNVVTTHRPRNPRFQAAVTAAKQANPTISAYVWEPALQLLAHPTFAGHAVAMVIEVQLYLDQFLQFRKLVHCYYKITRAPNLASLAQDCRKYAKNPALAFDTQKQVDADASKAGHYSIMFKLIGAELKRGRSVDAFLLMAVAVLVVAVVAMVFVRLLDEE